MKGGGGAVDQYNFTSAVAVQQENRHHHVVFLRHRWKGGRAVEQYNFTNAVADQQQYNGITQGSENHQHTRASTPHISSTQINHWRSKKSVSE